MGKIILKSVVIFVVMSLLNAQFSEWTVRFLKLPGGNFGMYSYLILIFCSVITAIGMVTVIIFRKSYHSILRMAILFEAIYLFFLLISGNNPFLCFSDATPENLLMMMMYVNSFIIFLIMYSVYLIQLKLISSKNKKLT